MKQTTYAVILMLLLGWPVFSQKISPKTSPKPPAAIEAGREVNRIFDVLFYGLERTDAKVGEGALRLSASTAAEVTVFLKNFPEAYEELQDDREYNGKYRSIVADYGNYFINFGLGNEPGRWKGKLFKVAFNVSLPDRRVPETETGVFGKLTDLYGQHAKVEKFLYFTGDRDPDLNHYVWELPDTVVTYRSFYDADDRKTVMVVEYWDRQFYKTQPYHQM